MEQNNLRNSVLGGFFWKFGESLLTQGAAFIISLILARILSPEDYGTVALVTVFINLATVFIRSGFSTALIQKKDADATDFSTMFFCSQLCSVVIYIVLFFSAPLVAAFYNTPILTDVMRVLALQIPLGVYNSIQTAYVSRHMLFRKVFIASLCSTVVSGIAGIAVALMGFGVWALVVQYIAATIATSVILTVLLPWRPEWKFSKTSAKSMMSYGTKLLAADLSGTFFSELKSLIVGRVYTSADLAFFNKGQQIPALMTNNVSGVITSVMFPTLANHSDNLEKLKQITRRSTRILVYVLVPCMFGLSAVMELLIILLFTEKWAESILYGQILSVGLCLSLIGNFSLYTLKAIGRSDVVLGLEIKKKPIYVLLVLLGVQHSVFGLAVAVLVYDFYAMVINMFQLKKYADYALLEQIQDLIPAFLLSTAMAVIVMSIPIFDNLLLTLLAKVTIGVLFYVVASAVFKMDSFIYLWNLLRATVKKQKKI